MHLIRYITLLLILYQYYLVSSGESSSDMVKGLPGAQVSDLLEKITNVWIEELHQLNAVCRRLQQHQNIVEMTCMRQSLRQKVSTLKQELQAYVRQHQQTIICKQLFSKPESTIQKRLPSTTRMVRTGNITTVCRNENLLLTASCTALGLATLNDKLFVGCREGGQIAVYDSSTLNFLRNFSVPDLECVSDMASCPRCAVVYISDRCNRMIHAINETGLRVQWNVDFQPCSLSVNSQLNVVVGFLPSLTLREFNSSGQLVGGINLRSYFMTLSYAIVSNDDQFIIVDACYTDADRDLRMYIINGTGTVIESFVENTREGTRLCPEVYLLLIGESLIVTDPRRNRLLLFNVSPLTYVRELTELDQRPHDIAISNNDTRLFVSVGREIRVFDIVWV